MMSDEVDEAITFPSLKPREMTGKESAQKAPIHSSMGSQEAVLQHTMESQQPVNVA